MESGHSPVKEPSRRVSPVSPRVTIRDVARAAGVSPATVSRALRDMPVVDQRTRLHVQAVARKMHFSVSPAASRLATGRAGTIGIVTPFVGRWYFTEVFAGIEQGLRQHDVDLLIHTTAFMTDLEVPTAAHRMRRRVDGVLIVGMSPDPVEFEELRALDLPVVLIGATAPGFDCVAIDDRLGAFLATNHLLEQGHRRVGLLTGRELPTPIRPEGDRFEGYVDALNAHGLPAPAELRCVGEFTSLGGYRAMSELLELPEPPTAVFAMSDEMAYGALRALARHGIQAGGDRERGDIAIVGFDGHDLAEAFELSTVAQPVREIGRTAVDLLMSRLDGSAPAAQQMSVPSITLQVRKSSRIG